MTEFTKIAETFVVLKPDLTAESATVTDTLSATMMFVAPGEGTENREDPPI